MMAGIVVIDRDGVEHEVEAKEGVSLMETLRDLDYGSPAICGGMCSCATCHVYVDEASLPRLAPIQGDEKELLVELSGYKPTSRLSCQVQFDASLAGIRVTIAPDE
jgi:ferredoxin